MPSTTPTTERRHSDRRRACFGATLRVAAFLPEIECRLRDHSLTGARIVVAADVPLPRLVDLTVPCRNRTRSAVVVWRSGTQAGLAFVDAAGPGEGSGIAPRADVEPDRVATPSPGRLH